MTRFILTLGTDASGMDKVSAHATLDEAIAAADRSEITEEIGYVVYNEDGEAVAQIDQDGAHRL